MIFSVTGADLYHILFKKFCGCKCVLTRESAFSTCTGTESICDSRNIQNISEHSLSVASYFDRPGKSFHVPVLTYEPVISMNPCTCMIADFSRYTDYCEVDEI